MLSFLKTAISIKKTKQQKRFDLSGDLAVLK